MNFKEKFRNLLKEPALDAKSIDDPSYTMTAGEIIKRKTFLRRIYSDFYNQFKQATANLPTGKIVELGSGAGFIKNIMPEVLTSDILDLPTVDLHFSALDMPFSSESIGAFLMIDVFHHVPDSKKFIEEMNRCLKVGGKIIMIEPFNSWWGRFIYKNFHHEPWIPDGDWSFPSSGPLSGANGALPWIVFRRDRDKFVKLFPNLEIKQFSPHTPFRYLLSGGLSIRQLAPDFSYGLIKMMELTIKPLNNLLGMFVTIEIQKNLNKNDK